MRLDTWRKSKNLTQAEVAELIGVADRVTVARYEGGRVPETDILKKIIEVTGGEVTANDFFGLEASPNGEAA